MLISRAAFAFTRGMVHFYTRIVPALIADHWRESQAVARSRR